jgi:hypothetical protein
VALATRAAAVDVDERVDVAAVRRVDVDERVDVAAVRRVDDERDDDEPDADERPDRDDDERDDDERDDDDLDADERDDGRAERVVDRAGERRDPCAREPPPPEDVLPDPLREVTAWPPGRA